MKRCKCGKPVPKHKHKYCSTECYLKNKLVLSREDNRRKTGWHKKRCHICGKPLTHGRRKYCGSEDCMREAERRDGRAYYKRNRKKILKRLSENYVQTYILSKRIRIYVNGFKGELEPMVLKIKEEKYNDLIKNPEKYLSG